MLPSGVGEGDVAGFGDWGLEADGPLPMIPHQVS